MKTTEKIMKSDLVEELLQELKEQNVKITEEPVYVKCHLDIITKESQYEGLFGENEEPKNEDEWKEYARDIAESVYAPEDLLDQYLYEIGEISDLYYIEVVDKSEISSPDWCESQECHEFDEGIVIETTVEFYVEVRKSSENIIVRVID